MKINNKEYKLKITLRAMLIFEKIMNRPFDSTKELDLLVYFYSTLVANNDNFVTEYSFEQFVDALDEQPELLTEFTKVLINYGNLHSIMNKENDGNVEEKKTFQ